MPPPWAWSSSCRRTTASGTSAAPWRQTSTTAAATATASGWSSYAAAHGFDSFTSTLFVSPYQNHDLLRQTAEAAAARYGVSFLYRDFRPGFRQGQQEARELGLYMQKYCGCVFSEEERYAKQLSRDMEIPEKHI